MDKKEDNLTGKELLKRIREDLKVFVENDMIASKIYLTWEAYCVLRDEGSFFSMAKNEYLRLYSLEINVMDDNLMERHNISPNSINYFYEVRRMGDKNGKNR